MSTHCRRRRMVSLATMYAPLALPSVAAIATMATSFNAHAQLKVQTPPRSEPARIGIVWLGDVPLTPFAPRSAAAQFRQSLRALGWIEGKSIAFESRFTGNGQHLSRQIEELVAMKMDVIVAMGTPIASAARNITTSIPVVFAVAGDPIKSGLIQSLRNPGGNLTGVYMPTAEHAGKRLSLLHEAVPSAKRIAVLHPPNALEGAEFKATRSAAKLLGVDLIPVEVRNNGDFEPAFNTAKNAGASAMSVLTDTRMLANLGRIAALSRSNQMPAIATYSGFTRSGGLMSYGGSSPESTSRAAAYVDRILRGAKPADLPVEQISKYTLALNKKTAAEIGLKFPQSLLQYADEVIE